MDLVFVKKHVGDALCDGESTAGLGAEEGALFEVELEEGVVEAPEEVVGVEHGGVGGVGKVRVAHGPRGFDESVPVDLGEHVSKKVGVEIHRLFDHFLDFDSEREAIGDPLDVG
ncbi:unnamed protein product [Camellia sinensis]